MPEANLLEYDMTNGLPSQILSKRYDAIISTYALHHLRAEGKFTFIEKLLPQLKAEGRIYIGDIAFQDREMLNSCRQENLDHWDEDEFYFVMDELESSLAGICHLEFHPISHCGGVIVISKRGKIEADLEKS